MADANGEGPRFALAYRLTRDDAAAYEDLRGEFSARAKAAMLLPLVILGASGGWLASSFGWDTGSWSVLKEGAVIGAVIALWFAAVTLGLSIARHRRVRRFPLPDDDVLLTAADDGIGYDEGAGLQRYPWSEVPWVHLGRAHVFVQTASRRVIIAPLRAFADADEMGCFARFADASSSAASP